MAVLLMTVVAARCHIDRVWSKLSGFRQNTNHKRSNSIDDNQLRQGRYVGFFMTETV